MEPRTGAERYLAEQVADPEFAEHYRAARARIDRIDRIVNAIEDRRTECDLTKNALARRAGLRPEVVRRLLSTPGANPTLNTVVALADALGLDFDFVPVADATRATPPGGAASEGSEQAAS